MSQQFFEAIRAGDRGAVAALLFYINHLAWEIAKAEQVWAPAAA